MKKYDEKTAQRAFELRFTYSQSEVAKILGIPTREQVYRLLKEYNYPSVGKKRRSNILSMSNEDKAYIAGIVDGEGHIHISGAVLITNTSEELMQWLVKKLGGVYKEKKVPAGRKKCFYYRTSVYKGRELLELINLI